MTDERIDALIRRLDVQSDPDPDFERSTFALLRTLERAARVSDASRFRRLRRDLRPILAAAPWSFKDRPVAVMGLIILLVLASLAAVLIVGVLNRATPIQNGPLVVSMHGELEAIDPLDGSVRPILPPGDYARGVSRSPDGRLVAFWTIGDGRSHLYVVGVDAPGRRELGADLRLGWTNAIDTWSSDSRFLATEVQLDGGGNARILLGDVASGAARVVTPPGLIAHNPLWSTDGDSIAFTEESGGIRSLAVIRTEGTGKRTVSGDVVGVAGPDTWSPDGTWIYFNTAHGGVYRANVAGGYSQLLMGNGLAFEAAYAPASSPDGKLIVFIVPRSDQQAYDLYVANSDGSHPRLLLERATHDGWSADGRYVLAEWTPTNQPGGLAVMTTDGGQPQVVLPFDSVCQHGPRCTDGVGWGQPRP